MQGTGASVILNPYQVDPLNPLAHFNFCERSLKEGVKISEEAEKVLIAQFQQLS